MDQKTPQISDMKIKQIIGRDFSDEEASEVEDLLRLYKADNANGKNRVCASILKLSNGKIELIKKYVEQANIDYRDLIALSEYPNYSEHAFEDDLPDYRKKKLLDDDWKQYQRWLNKE